MNQMKRAILSCGLAAGLLALTGCSHSGAARLVNERTFSLDGVSEITISYDEETITFLEGKSGELVLREYMTRDKSSYYAKIEQSGGQLQISEGGKPWLKSGFVRYVEVYLPADYGQSLTITTTDGGIELSQAALEVDALRIDSTAGAIQIGSAQARDMHLSTTSGAISADCLRAGRVKIETTSGSFTCQRLEGQVDYTTTSGDGEIREAVGAGSYRANNSGGLAVAYTEVTGDLSLFNKNDGIRLTLPADLEFELTADTKNGTVSLPFQDFVTQGRTTKGRVGEHPAVTVTLETNNGNIEVIQ